MGLQGKNFKRISEYMEAAAGEGVNLILFPEMALTGYADEPEKEFTEKMQYKEAEAANGLICGKISDLSQRLNIYSVIGMPVLENGKLYNAAGLFYPNGSVDFYKKIHLAQATELNWASKGNEPKMLDTPWGKIGVAICYDVYFFPELIRYYVAKGCRLILNLTAYSLGYGLKQAIYPMATYVFTNSIFIAAANLCGTEKDGEYYWGGSCVIGPSEKPYDISYFAGIPFGNEDADRQGMFTATIDLSEAKRSLYKINPVFNTEDFRAELYAKLYNELANGEIQH